jgi:hypothetical protein
MNPLLARILDADRSRHDARTELTRSVFRGPMAITTMGGLTDATVLTFATSKASRYALPR